MNRLNYLVGLVICSLVACAPATKEDFLNEFSAFVEEIEQKENKQVDVDWTAKDKAFDQYTSEMYTKFKSEMSIMDEVKFNANKVRYNVRRHKSGFLDELLKDKDLIKLRRELKQYIDNDMDADVQKLVNEAEKVGEEFGKSVEELVEELKREFETKD